MTTSSSTPTSPNVSRFTGFILGLIVFVCISMIGLAGYLKFELDRAENELTAPDQAMAPDQEAFEKFRRNLGYSGFTGMARAYSVTHDASVVPDMKAQLKQAADTVAHLPEKTPAEVRHDLQSILMVFDEALSKIDKSANDPVTGFTPADMAPLYAALPILDSRITSAAATDRVTAQNHMQMWATLLTLVSWCSLIIAAALAAGIYLTLRDRNSAPLRALAQSVKNMARGDMRTPIWGMERQDTLGELARAVDMARFQFSQLPDMALLSEQGPVRIRFEGNTRSLFEAMMRVISRDSEQVHQQTAALTEAIKQQQQTVASMASQVGGILQAVQIHATEGDTQVRQALQNILASAQGLKNAQEHAADQLNRIIPFMQERAQGLAEITQITGKEVAQVLQNLMVSGRTLRINAEQGDETIKRLATTADGLGERLFGAVNLLQASGKVLAETTETTRSRLEEAIERLNLKNLSAACFTSNSMVTPDDIAAAAASAPVDYMREELGNLGAAMSHILTRLDELGARGGQPVSGSVTAPPGDIGPRLEELAALVRTMPEKIAGMMPRGEGAVMQIPASNDVMMEIKTGFEVMGQNLERTREQLRAVAMSTPADPGNLSAQIRDQWSQMAGQIEATRAALEQSIAQQIGRLEERFANVKVEAPATSVQPEMLREAQQQMEQQTHILTELVATLGALDAHMQEIRSQVSGGQKKAG